MGVGWVGWEVVLGGLGGLDAHIEPGFEMTSPPGGRTTTEAARGRTGVSRVACPDRIVGPEDIFFCIIRSASSLLRPSGALRDGGGDGGGAERERKSAHAKG